MLFLYKQHIYNQRQAEIGKNQANAKQQPETELLLFENYSHALFTYGIIYKKQGLFYENKQNNKCVCIHEIIRLIIMKIRKNEK